MIPEDWLEYVVQKEKELKRPPDPIKRRQPKITRMTSRRMRTVNGQTPNPIRAMYTTENDYNRTPTLPDDATTTREVRTTGTIRPKVTEAEKRR